MSPQIINHSKPSVSMDVITRFEGFLSKNDLCSEILLNEVKNLLKDTFSLENFSFAGSGTHALYWILKGLRIGKGDEVIIPTYVCDSVYQAVIATGARPVLCDIEKYWHMSPKNVEKHINKKTKAIVIVNLFGMSVDASSFRHFELPLINDFCQTIATTEVLGKDRGDFGFYSFHPTKFLTSGQGGGLSILNPRIPFENFLSLDQIGSTTSNFNLLILKDQIFNYHHFVSKRKQLADVYFSELDEEYTSSIKRKDNIFYRFPLTKKGLSFEKISAFFEDKKILVRRGVDSLIHRKIREHDQNFPNAISAFNKTLSLPIYPSLEVEDIHRISSAFNEFLRSESLQVKSRGI